MTVMTDLVTPAAVQTLGWTLLHFLWQGTAVALAVAVLLWLTKTSGPVVRYGLACAGLAVAPTRPYLRRASASGHNGYRAEL